MTSRKLFPGDLLSYRTIKEPRDNNRIERLNGTLRERVKIQRGWKTYKTKIAEGQRIHYDFVKPHQALEGKTPANAVGIQVKGWNELLAKAIDNDNKQTI